MVIVLVVFAMLGAFSYASNESVLVWSPERESSGEQTKKVFLRYGPMGGPNPESIVKLDGSRVLAVESQGSFRRRPRRTPSFSFETALDWSLMELSVGIEPRFTFVLNANADPGSIRLRNHAYLGFKEFSEFLFQRIESYQETYHKTLSLRFILNTDYAGGLNQELIARSERSRSKFTNLEIWSASNDNEPLFSDEAWDIPGTLRKLAKSPPFYSWQREIHSELSETLFVQSGGANTRSVWRSDGTNLTAIVPKLSLSDVVTFVLQEEGGVANRVLAARLIGSTRDKIPAVEWEKVFAFLEQHKLDPVGLSLMTALESHSRDDESEIAYRGKLTALATSFLREASNVNETSILSWILLRTNAEKAVPEIVDAIEKIPRDQDATVMGQLLAEVGVDALPRLLDLSGRNGERGEAQFWVKVVSGLTAPMGQKAIPILAAFDFPDRLSPEILNEGLSAADPAGDFAHGQPHARRIARLGFAKGGPLIVEIIKKGSINESDLALAVLNEWDPSAAADVIKGLVQGSDVLKKSWAKTKGAEMDLLP